MDLPVETTIAVEQALDALSAYQMSMREARRYVEGDQPLSFATEKFRSAFGAIFRAFAINYCALVVNIINDYIVLKGARHEDDDEEVQGDISTVFERNYLSSLAKTAHAEALITGQSAIIIWPDRRGFPIFFPNRGDRSCLIPYPGIVSSARIGSDTIPGYGILERWRPGWPSQAIFTPPGPHPMEGSESSFGLSG